MTFSKKIKISAEKESDASYCGIVPSGDPRVFGPFTWETFHVMAQNYPQTPNQVTITQCQNFVNAIPYMIPCSQCGYHFQKFIEEKFLPFSFAKIFLLFESFKMTHFRKYSVMFCGAKILVFFRFDKSVH